MPLDSHQPDTPPADPGLARLEDLLDQALAAERVPGGIPPGLAERVLQRTAPLVQNRRAVLARLGSWGGLALGGLAAVAAILLVAAGLALVANPLSDSALVPNPLVAALQDVEQEIHALARYTGPDEAIDQELAGLALDLDRSAQPSDLDQLNRALEQSLDEWSLTADADMLF